MSKFYSIYFIIFFINLFFLLNYKKIASFLNIFDIPNESRKLHSSPVPILGGLILYLNLLLIFLFNFFNKNILEKNTFFILITVSSFIFLLGFIDDKFRLSANRKLFILSLILLIFCLIDENILIKEIQFSFFKKPIFLNKLSLFFTIFCFLLFINSFNMFDGINLQCGLYSLFIFIYLIFNGTEIILISLFIIPLLFFLYLNHKNNCFLGDSGSHFLGFFLGYLIVKDYNLNRTYFADEIFLIMAVPGYDLLRLAIIRLLKKKHPFSPDNQHIHHLILKKNNIFFTNFIIQTLIILPVIFMVLFHSMLFAIIISLVAYSYTIYKFTK
jgi:UDP-GlcNAc:undecaprenyl-phosphate/decaprenyl-phosphate GlcNAc-1-phosphate transferase